MDVGRLNSLTIPVNNIGYAEIIEESARTEAVQKNQI